MSDDAVRGELQLRESSHSGRRSSGAALGQQSEAFGRTVIGPAMGIVLLAGLWMAGQFGIPFTSLWIVWGLVGWVVFILLGVVALRQRISLLSWLNLLVLASVIWAMVFKPTL